MTTRPYYRTGTKQQYKIYILVVLIKSGSSQPSGSSWVRARFWPGTWPNTCPTFWKTITRIECHIHSNTKLKIFTADWRWKHTMKCRIISSHYHIHFCIYSGDTVLLRDKISFLIAISDASWPHIACLYMLHATSIYARSVTFHGYIIGSIVVSFLTLHNKSILYSRNTMLNKAVTNASLRWIDSKIA